MATQLATQEEPRQRTADPVMVIRQNLTKMEPEFRAALPSHISVEKFSRVAMTAINNTPALLSADRKSLFGAFVRLAQDGLLPDGREAAIVMFGNKAQAMPMIAGVLKKIRQSGDVAKVSAQVVYEKDEFVWKLGFDEDVIHNPPPLDQPRGKPIGAYATAVLKDGSRLLEVMNLDEIEQVRNVSRAAKNGPWVAWWGEMARKTVMRRLSKRLPMSTDIEDSFERDETLPRDEPETIEHEQPPRSRLDALEHHIEATAEPAHIEETNEQADELEAEIAEVSPASAAADGSGEADLPQDGDAAGAGQEATTFERMQAIAQGPDDSQRGEIVTLASAKDEIDRCEIVPDVNARVLALREHLGEEDASDLMLYAGNRIEELKAKK